MSQSNLIELTYYDPKANVRLTTYADTIITEPDSKGESIAAVRFGGYPEMVRAMSDAIYGGGDIDLIQSGNAYRLKSTPKAYRRQLSHDGTYTTATLMINDEALSAISSDEDDGEDNEKEAAPAEPEPPKHRKCYIFCPAGDRESLFAEVDRKTAAPLIPEFQDYVLETLTARKILRKLKVFTLSEKLDAWTLDLLPDDKNIVDVLEQGLQEGKISIPGAAPDSPDGFDGVTSVTSYLNTFGVTVAERIRNQFEPLFDPASEPLSEEVLAVNDYMAIQYDGYSIRQMDLSDMFGEKDVFLSIFNPLYFIEELGDEGKNLLEMYLPKVSQADVLAQLSEPVRLHLEKEDILSPEAYLRARREKIRSLEEQITYITGQRDQAAAQKQLNAERRQSLPQRYDSLQRELAELKEKQFAGLDVAAMNEKLMECSERYSEARRDGQTDDHELREQLTALREKIAARKAEQYQSKYTHSLAEAQARVQALSAQYNQDAAAYKALTPGAPCPICRRPITEDELPKIQEELCNSAAAVLAQGQEQQAQIKELQELDQKARETFEQFQADDLAKWGSAAQQLESKIQQLADDAAAQAESLRVEIQQLTADLEYGNLAQEEYDRLQACREDCRQCEAEMTAFQSVDDVDAASFDQQISNLKAEIIEQKKLIADVTIYASKRAEMTFSALKMNRVEISLFDVVKSTGEWKDAFKFTYNGRRYDRLSLSEKVRAGMEVSELVKRLTGRNYPVFVDNMESIDDLENARPTGQLFLAKCVSKLLVKRK